MSVLRLHVAAHIAAFFGCRGFRCLWLRLLDRAHCPIEIFRLLSAWQIRRTQDPRVLIGCIEFVADFLIGPFGESSKARHFSFPKRAAGSWDQPTARVGVSYSAYLAFWIHATAVLRRLAHVMNRSAFKPI